jgi:limonene-1,2-epoxide hydrolase
MKTEMAQNEVDILTDNNERKQLNIVTIKELWSQTYNTHGKPDWSHIFKYYHKDIVFQDTIQRIEGIDNFIAMCNRLTMRTKELNMEIVSIVQNDNTIIFEWVMTMMFKKYPSTPLYGCDNFILQQRDYYDLWGDIFNNIPRFGKMYRRFIIKKFG